MNELGLLDPHDDQLTRRVWKTCPLCFDGVPHHTNSATSIGGPDRHTVWDLHQMDHGGLEECRAYEIYRDFLGVWGVKA